MKYKLSRFNIYLIAKPSITLKSVVCKKIDPIQPYQLSGVYEIPFTRADGTLQYYIGMTTRKFKTRLKEHMTDITYDRNTTVLTRLHRTETLKIDFKNSKIIYPTRLYFPSIIRESIEIFMRNVNICNESASFELPKILHEVLSVLKKQ